MVLYKSDGISITDLLNTIIRRIVTVCETAKVPLRVGLRIDRYRDHGVIVYCWAIGVSIKKGGFIARELEDKVAHEVELTFLICHGGNHSKEPTELAKFHVILVAYALVTKEVSDQQIVAKKKSRLCSRFSINYTRIKKEANNSKNEFHKGIDGFLVGVV
ncbi:hypothetical protein M5689_018871 [Euphorbia peplus]|nr:hypothetical protein M5689_018871 [Euphorbia peplus]